LGRLAGYLRMLGFDTTYSNRATDPELVQMAAAEKRILLTRDRGLLKHSAVTHGYWLRETDSRRQTAEVVRRFELARLVHPFTRCMVCNEPLHAASGIELCHCPGCGWDYWEGSHHARMRRWIAELTAVSE